MKTKEIYILIYLIGFLISYVMFKTFVRKQHTWNQEWSSIFVNMFIGLLSYVGIFLILTTEYETIFKKININIKPPKWL